MWDGVDDDQLVEGVLTGNKGAFFQLMGKYEKLVLHIVTPLIGVNADREDICQDVFIKVYEKLFTFRFQSTLGTWIGSIAYNTSINFLKQKRSVLLCDLVSEADETAFIDSLQSDFDDPEQILVKLEDQNRLKAAVDQLPRIQRSLLLLFYQDELSLNEIGLIMDMPVNTVKSHLFRARRKLKELLRPE